MICVLYDNNNSSSVVMNSNNNNNNNNGNFSANSKTLSNIITRITIKQYYNDTIKQNKLIKIYCRVNVIPAPSSIPSPDLHLLLHPLIQRLVALIIAKAILARIQFRVVL